MKRYFLLILCGLLLCGTVRAEAPRGILLRGLSSPGFWTRVHAAEYLLELGLEKPAVRKTFQSMETQSSAKVYDRVGQHRVMIRLGDAVARREAELLRIAMDAGAPDRVHAIETIGKLQGIVSPAAASRMEALWRDPRQPADVRGFAAWSPGNDEPAREAVLRGLLQEQYARTSLPVCAVAGLTFFPVLSQAGIHALDAVFRSGRYAPAVRLAAAELLLKRKKITFPEIRALWDKSPHRRAESKAFCRILSGIPVSAENLAMLYRMLGDEDLETAMGAAFAILKSRANQYGTDILEQKKTVL